MTTIDDVACTVCGCVCDDISVQVEGGRILSAEGACRLADARFFGRHDAASVAAIRGQPTTIEDAVARSAALLASSRSPLIYGLSQSSTCGQRAAVKLADVLGATIDTTASTCHAPSILALQRVGESTSTLGEAKNRADLVVYWGSNPEMTHPRHVERLVNAPGQFVPRGRLDRHLIVIDVKQTETTELADTYIRVDPGGDFELIWTLRAILGGHSPTARAAGGVPRQTIDALAERLAGCRFGAVFFGLGLTRHAVPHATIEALLQLITDLHRHTRFVIRRMRVPGDVAGADSVLCWQTGFPFSVNLSRGYPRYNPGEFTAGCLLERGEVDAVVLVGSAGIELLSEQARAHLSRVPTILLDSPQQLPDVSAEVQFTTAVHGLHRTGTAYRMDEVPIPLRSVLSSSLPSDAEILGQITQRLAGSVPTPVISNPSISK